MLLIYFYMPNLVKSFVENILFNMPIMLIDLHIKTNLNN